MVNMGNIELEDLKFLGIIAARTPDEAALKARIQWGDKVFLTDSVVVPGKMFLVLSMTGQYLGMVKAASIQDARKEAAARFRTDQFVLDEIRIGNKAFAVYEILNPPPRIIPQLELTPITQPFQPPPNFQPAQPGSPPVFIPPPVQQPVTPPVQQPIARPVEPPKPKGKYEQWVTFAVAEGLIRQDQADDYLSRIARGKWTERDLIDRLERERQEEEPIQKRSIRAPWLE